MGPCQAMVAKATLEFPKGSVKTFEGLPENLQLLGRMGRLNSSTLIANPGFLNIPHT